MGNSLKMTKEYMKGVSEVLVGQLKLQFYSDWKMEQIKVGDTIKCHDKDDCVNYMNELAKCGIETDFLYEKD